MTKFVKNSKVAQEISNILATRIQEADSFPQVFFIPELIYQAVLHLHGNDRELAYNFTRSRSKLDGFSPLNDELTESLDTLAESLVNRDSTKNNLDFAISNDAIMVTFQIDGQVFKDKMLRTLTVYELPKYVEGAYFGVFPLPTLEECEKLEEEEIEAELLHAKQVKSDKAKKAYQLSKERAKSNAKVEAMKASEESGHRDIKNVGLQN